MNDYRSVMRQYAQFRGRAGRAGYWNFVGMNVLFGIGAYLLDRLLRLPDHGIDLAWFLVPASIGRASGLFLPLYILAVFVPFLAVTVRRLHDTGRSGWWCLIELIPIAGQIALIILCTLPGDPGENAYGPPAAEQIPVPLLQKDLD